MPDSSVMCASHDSPPKVPFEATPRTLGCYELLLPLGSGGMATVWTARRKGTRGFQKIVAVKVMHDRLRQSGTHERMFLDEARIAFQTYLSQYLEEPEISIDVSGFNSAV